MDSHTSPLVSKGLDPKTGWFHEGTVPGRRHGNVNHGFRITNLVHFAKTKYQDVLIFDNPVYGRVLVLDGIVQLSTSDEHRYHEMLVHPAMFTHPSPRRVLIVGGGDGGTLRETLRHSPEQVVMIDIDGEFVEQAARFLPTLSAGAFDDPRLTLLHEDAACAIDRYSDFDVLIVDGNDAMGPSVPLFGSPFYARVARALASGGVCAVQVGSFLDEDFIKTTRARISEHLPNTALYRFTMPSYHCGEYCFLMAAKDCDPAGPAATVIEERMKQRGIAGLKYYTPAMHHASQVLPTSSAW
jgi:spermidine synthase